MTIQNKVDIHANILVLNRKIDANLEAYSFGPIAL